jgi:hypothetical protein
MRWSARLPEPYTAEFERVAGTAFSMWNRDPASPSFGSFDRAYWGWKYKDFSDATLQYAVILACEHARRCGRTGALPALLEGFVDYCAEIQHGDGSYDQCYPYERTPGVIYDILPALTYVRRSPFLESQRSRSKLDGVIGGAVEFALRTDERHGEVANHIAEYAWELLDYAAQSGDDAARRRGDAYVERLLALFDRDEGWFLEYNGADAGYQSRCLRYFAKIAALKNDPLLWEIAEKAAGFVAALLMPDRSLNPMLGCRSTALLYPSSFETLAGRSDALRAAAQGVREAWQRRHVPMPSEIDFCNAIRLAHDAMDAADGASDLGGSTASTAPGSFHLPHAGIAMYASDTRRVYVATRLGGAYSVYERDASDTWTIAREEAGYLLRSPDKSKAWVTRMAGVGELKEHRADGCRIDTPFVRSLHDEVTPLRMLVLRVLNLSVLRVQWLADLFRKVVVRRLISGIDPLPLHLDRTITLEQDAVIVKDRIFSSAPGFRPEGTRLFACRRVTGAHMASARYFQPVELDDAWIQELVWDGTQERVRVERVPARSHR